MIDLLVSPPVIGLVLVLALTTLYKISLPLKPPWWRGLPGAVLAAVVFWLGATGLRVYLDWLTSTGYTYGALAAPIAFLLATFFIGWRSCWVPPERLDPGALARTAAGSAQPAGTRGGARARRRRPRPPTRPWWRRRPCRS